MALAYAAASVGGVDGQPTGSICFTTTNYSHLRANLAARPLTQEWVNTLHKLSRHVHIVRYKGSSTGVNSNWVKEIDEEYIRHTIVPQLVEDIKCFRAGSVPSKLAISIPKPHRRGGQVHIVLAKFL